MLAMLTALALAFTPAQNAAARDSQDAEIARSIEAQGGRVARDQSSRIVDVSLARTWATDADVERVANIKGLKRLDLSLTYVSDRGAERLKALTQLEELNLSSAEFITDAAKANYAASPISELGAPRISSRRLFSCASSWPQARAWGQVGRPAGRPAAVTASGEA